VLDFVSMRTTNRQLDNRRPDGGWHHIAWAFLKVGVYVISAIRQCCAIQLSCLIGALFFYKSVGLLTLFLLWL